MHRLVQVTQKVDKHLHGIRVAELDALLGLVVIHRGEVDGSALVFQDLAVEMLDRSQQANAILALRDQMGLRAAMGLSGAVVVHLEVHPGHAGERVVHLMTPTSNIGDVLAAQEPLRLPDRLLIHGAGRGLSDGIVRLDIEGYCTSCATCQPPQSPRRGSPNFLPNRHLRAACPAPHRAGVHARRGAAHTPGECAGGGGPLVGRRRCPALPGAAKRTRAS
mmetsp:Transcript_96674/g.259924  ORF Transcript_96674/g.259924 Transcript_96674/m.259924 type:complete len:220 (+) Transcript_96674:870-1529(+)